MCQWTIYGNRYIIYLNQRKRTTKGDKRMKQITNIRKTVCTMANKLKKQGYSLSQAFRKAWKRVKVSIKIRAVGTTSENIQERLKFMKQFPV